MDFLIFANTTINTQSYLIHMKRFILPLLIIILILTSLPTKANNEIESLLKTLDKSLQHKSVYTKQKQRQIDSLTATGALSLSHPANSIATDRNRIIFFTFIGSLQYKLLISRYLTML